MAMYVFFFFYSSAFYFVSTDPIFSPIIFASRAVAAVGCIRERNYNLFQQWLKAEILLLDHSAYLWKIKHRQEHYVLPGRCFQVHGGISACAMHDQEIENCFHLLVWEESKGMVPLNSCLVGQEELSLNMFRAFVIP